MFQTGERGKRLHLIILSEGAIDSKGNHISAEQVKDILIKRTKGEVRVTILGHVQRGGRTSAYDRILVRIEKSSPSRNGVASSVIKNLCLRVLQGEQIRNGGGNIVNENEVYR